MDLVARVQGILLKPKEEWVKIKGESTSVAQLFTGYAILLAAIPAIAQFVGRALIGTHVPFVGWVRWNMGSSILYAVIAYVLSLVGVYVLGVIINALAPSFGSKQSMEKAMKLSVYSMTPSWIAGVLFIIPVLGILAAIAGLYGLYILYLGFSEPLMDTPKEKVMGYLVVSIVVGIVLYFVVGLIAGAIIVGGAYRGL